MKDNIMIKAIGKLIGVLLFSSIVFAVVFWFIAFIVWSADPSTWHWIARLTLLILSLLFIVIVFNIGDSKESGRGGN